MSEETVNILETLLPIYYKRLFPFALFHKWLSYGDVNKNCFANREFSFTLKDDVYIRYQSFSGVDELQKEVIKKIPFKMDIGAVYSSRPKDHKTAFSFQPVEKELVFDIDMTDYDDVRYCCKGADICDKCWPLMRLAVKILDRALKEDFGFNHMLWVYSGRRGIHCWVCDEQARKLSKNVRSSIVDYLSLVVGGDRQSKKVNLYYPVHPSVREALTMVKKSFTKLVIEGQDILGTPEKVEKTLQMIKFDKIRMEVNNAMKSSSSSEDKWEQLVNSLNKINMKLLKEKHNWSTEEIMLQYCYPRLDANVSIGVNHLLKSPFCVHPKTGRVCVPFSAAKVDEFDPFSVPTISQLIEEIDKYDSENSKEAENDSKPKLKDYKKTTLKRSIDVFKNFVIKMEPDWHEKRIHENDQKMEF